MTDPTRALVVPGRPALPSLPSHAEMQTMLALGEQFVKSGLLPNVKTAAAALLLIEKGRELEVPPVYALTHIHIVEGKPTASAEMMLALIYRDHGDEAIRISETTPQQCVIRYRRRGWATPESFTLTMEEMRRIAAGKKNWETYPAAMLRARAISAVARMAFPDTVAGMYTPEELESDGTAGATFTAEPITISEVAEASAAPPAQRRAASAVEQFAASAAMTRADEPLAWTLDPTAAGCQAVHPTKGQCPSAKQAEDHMHLLRPGERLCLKHYAELVVHAGQVERVTPALAVAAAAGEFTAEPDDLPFADAPA